MPITILAPKEQYDSSDDEYGGHGGVDAEGDVEMDGARPPESKRRKGSKLPLVTPGEIVTSDSQWMRCVTFILWELWRIVLEVGLTLV